MHIPPLNNPYLSALSGVLSLAMGIFVFQKNSQSRLNRVFFFLCLLYACWFIGNGLSIYFVRNFELALLFWRIAVSFVPLCAPIYYQIYLILAGKKSKFLKLLYFVSVLEIIYLWADKDIRVGLYFLPNVGGVWNKYSSFSVLLTFGMIKWIVVSFSSAVLIFLIAKKEKDRFKSVQLRYFSFIFFLAGTGGSLEWLPTFDIPLHLGWFTIPLFLLLFAYGVIKHRFMEIDTVVHKTLLWFATIILLIIPLSVVIDLSLSWLNTLPVLLKVVILSLFFLFFIIYYQLLKPKIDQFFRRRKYDYQKALAEIPSRIGAELELASLTARLFKEFKDVLYIQNGLLLVKLPQEDNYEEIGSIGYDQLEERGIVKEKTAALPLDSDIIKCLTQYKCALEKEQVEADPQYIRIKPQLLQFFQECHLEILVPVFLKDGLKGLLGLGKKENLQSYKLKDIQLLEQLGLALGVTLDNALHHQDIVEKERLSEELKLGREIQMGLIPKEVPDTNGLDIAGFMETAKEIGGDYYDFIPFNENDLGIVIGDVSGKGVAAGLLMAMAKTAVHILSQENDSPKQILNRTNQLLYQYTRAEKFMSMLYLRWNGENRQLRYSSAGHEHIIVYRYKPQGQQPQDKSNLEIIKSGGFVLGMLPEINEFLEEKSLTLHSKDKVVLYTDGITDARDNAGKMFGLPRLIKIIEQYGDRPPQELIDLIKQELYNFIGKNELYDDVTLVVAEGR